MTIIERIEQLNSERGWSLYELSKRSDIAEATVYTWKRKNKCPSMTALEKICKSYGITLFQFFSNIYNPDYTEEQNRLITQWSILDSEEKAIIDGLIIYFISRK